MSKLLIEESPLQVLPTLATAIGLNEAIVLQQIHYWLKSYQHTRSKAHHRKGRWWVYNTYEQWQADNFPFWSTSTIRRAINELEKRGLLIGEQLERHDWQRRKWYTIDYKKLDELEASIRSAQDEQIEHVQDGQIDTTQNEQIKYTETTTEKKDSADAIAPAPRFAVGDDPPTPDDPDDDPSPAAALAVPDDGESEQGDAPKPKRSAKQQARDALFDAIREHCFDGGGADSRIGRMVSLAQREQYTPDLIASAAKFYRQQGLTPARGEGTIPTMIKDYRSAKTDQRTAPLLTVDGERSAADVSAALEATRRQLCQPAA
jgi:DNA-binding PadR family transcriptional regulator